MTTWAIGDIQGCDASFDALLDAVAFDPAVDRLWLVGDLVNRGPGSGQVLDRVRAMGPAVTSVLGNHDLALVACHLGLRKRKRRDTLDDVLARPDIDDLVEWLIHRPLMERIDDHVLVHAGIHPGWTLDDATAAATEASGWLRRAPDVLLAASLSRTGPPAPDDSLDAARHALQVFTLTRLVRDDGQLDLEFKGPPDRRPAGLTPWFEAPARRTDGVRIVFGHWAALGVRVTPHAVGLDSGCVWGGSLTAWSPDDGSIVQVDAREP